MKLSRLFLFVVVFSLVSLPLLAVNDCVFLTTGTTMTLQDDCTIDTSIVVPDGYTLDCAENVLTLVDPPAGHFVGAGIQNAGWMGVKRCVIQTSGLANVCDAGADRLRGIMLENAGGFVKDNMILSLNQGPSGCQEGNGIEIRNEPYDGTHPSTVNVEVSGNTVSGWEKTGIVANGDVNVKMKNNVVHPSATQANLAANSIQLGFGAMGTVEKNLIAGNTWAGPSDYSSSAFLCYECGPATIRQNTMNEGNADVAFYLFGDNLVVENNKAFDVGADVGFYDIGFSYYGSDISAYNNKARGFDTPFEGGPGVKDKAIPSPQD